MMKILKMRRQPIVTVQQMLRRHPGFGNHGHEVGIALPARHDMPMKMILHSRAGAFSKVHTEIYSGGLQDTPNDIGGPSQRFAKVGMFVDREFGKIPLVLLRR